MNKYQPVDLGDKGVCVGEFAYVDGEVVDHTLIPFYGENKSDLISKLELIIRSIKKHKIVDGKDI